MKHFHLLAGDASPNKKRRIRNATNRELKGNKLCLRVMIEVSMWWSIRRNPRVPVRTDRGGSLESEARRVWGRPPRLPPRVVFVFFVRGFGQRGPPDCAFMGVGPPKPLHPWSEDTRRLVGGGASGAIIPIKDPIKTQGPMRKQASVWISKLSLMDGRTRRVGGDWAVMMGALWVIPTPLDRRVLRSVGWRCFTAAR